MQLIDGKKVSLELTSQVKRDIEVLKKETGANPKLVVVQVGEDPASNVYINQKRKAAEASGMLFEHMKFGADISQEELIKKVVQLNEDKAVTGFIVQTPLPKHINEPQVFKHINPYKDVDGCTAYNTGKMFLSLEFEDLAPCTPLGCIRLLEHYKIDVKGKNVVVIGSSNTVGKPLAIMLSNRKATVTICNSKTVDLAAHTRNADIVCVAVGKAKMVTADMVKDGVIIIDIGINRTEEGKLVGDVDFDEVAKKASFITPVPGGVGPMTVACLMENTYKAAKRQTNNLNNK
ncbi:MAG: bifunctional 5,10-methylene-tetrahydrofolate dehydrogenase/5,10-methylene-tetrahydrofolate cyclohydrolase, methylenetetrahydrofolate dehydrogenase (NADP+) / methenyltetrahydrofolate cyclohydrolase [Candidatus Peregrinibacteria bacterium GW2011_GWF2_38_29]|nr:MAG: bifunctional 5,10-methylene-tetrahydrofolate dehydrogenase/5,10-methylene-tetrahydrofolate cyclohydrolase, methylenetetrahydrofolate dehydrogenase (NADP+) / methenyltetrahydrofolate cyclohydrolase [Candidatus Peregrinibacteria bacterium GW2011_GWF2_38_29]HBB02679.1 bifunctional methylenetetrahydrofolate dehydrogenase/methenyltetrahydrofolate cyclohydrolase [Candidatus Peregrinibacteria bacterium]